MTKMHWAVQNGNLLTFELEMYPSLTWNWNNIEQDEMVTTLIENGANLNAKDKTDEKTPLYVATLKSNLIVLLKCFNAEKLHFICL